MIPMTGLSLVSEAPKEVPEDIGERFKNVFGLGLFLVYTHNYRKQLFIIHSGRQEIPEKSLESFAMNNVPKGWDFNAQSAQQVYEDEAKLKHEHAWHKEQIGKLLTEMAEKEVKHQAHMVIAVSTMLLSLVATLYCW